jgi:hypothetical protein
MQTSWVAGVQKIGNLPSRLLVVNCQEKVRLKQGDFMLKLVAEKSLAWWQNIRGE